MSAEHKQPGTNGRLSVTAGHELTDAAAAPLLKFLVFLLATTIVIAAAMVFFYNYLEHREAVDKAPRYPLAAGRPRALPPPPRLQHEPFQDVKSLRQEEVRLLHEYDWIDRAGGTVRIPIGRAMEVLAERGLPHRAAPPEAADPAAAATGAGPLAPSRAGSGREPMAAPDHGDVAPGGQPGAPDPSTGDEPPQ